MAITGAPELLIVMGASATSEQVDEVVARLDEAGCSALVTPGRDDLGPRVERGEHDGVGDAATAADDEHGLVLQRSGDPGHL